MNLEDKNSGQVTREEDIIDLWDYVEVVVRRRRMIIRNCIVVFFSVMMISFFLPKTYTAITTLLPPDRTEQRDFLSVFSEVPLSNLGLTTGNTKSELFVEILKSRTVSQGVLKRKYLYKGKEQTLLEIWDTKSLEQAQRKLAQKSKFAASEEGIISIQVEMRDRNLAAAVANAFAEELDKVNKEKSTSKAKSSRIYIENQLKETEKKLKIAAEELAKFQEKHKAVSLEEQTKTAIEKAGEIKGRILAKEVELGVMLQTQKEIHPAVKALQRELQELKKQYDELQYGNDISLEEKKEFYIPFSEVPEIGLQLAQLTREVKVQETVWELLNQQYYQAKIQEARDTPTVQVLDKAVPPEKRSKPKRKLMVLVASFLTLILSTFWAFVQEYFVKVSQDTQTYSKVQSLALELKADTNRLITPLPQKVQKMLRKR